MQNNDFIALKVHILHTFLPSPVCAKWNVVMVRVFTGLLFCDADCDVEGGVDDAVKEPDDVSNKRRLELPGIGETKSTAVGPVGD